MKKIINLLLFLSLVAGSCLAQYPPPTPQYAVYRTTSVDNTQHVTQTVLVSGTTTGSCWHPCGTGGQQQCAIPNCVGAAHTPTVCNKVGGIGTCTTGPAYDMFAQMDYQTTIGPFWVETGHDYTTDTSATILCSGFGASFFSGGVHDFFGVAETLTRNLSGSAGYGCTTNHAGITTCHWSLAENCITPPVAWNPSSVSDTPPGLAGWDTWAACFRASSAQPWDCGPWQAVTERALKTTQTTPAACKEP